MFSYSGQNWGFRGLVQNGKIFKEIGPKSAVSYATPYWPVNRCDHGPLWGRTAWECQKCPTLLCNIFSINLIFSLIEMKFCYAFLVRHHQTWGDLGGSEDACGAPWNWFFLDGRFVGNSYFNVAVLESESVHIYGFIIIIVYRPISQNVLLKMILESKSKNVSFTK